MNDSDPVRASSKKQPSDLTPVVGNIFKKIPWKLMIYVFIIYLLLSSDVFIKAILNNINGAVGFSNSPTTYGTIITGLLLVIFVAITDILIKQKII